MWVSSSLPVVAYTDHNPLTFLSRIHPAPYVVAADRTGLQHWGRPQKGFWKCTDWCDVPFVRCLFIFCLFMQLLFPSCPLVLLRAVVVMWPFTVLERCKFKCAISTVSFAPLAATAFLPAADWRNGFLLLCRFTECGLQLCQSSSTNHGTAHYLTLLLSLEKVADHTDSLPRLWLVYTVVLADDSLKRPSTWPIFVPVTFAC